MTIQENIPLSPYTTFHIGGKAQYFCIVTNDDEVLEAVHFAKKNHVPYFILGGGSNILVSDEGFAGLVIKMEIKGMKGVDSERLGILSVGAGENWDSFVEWTIKNGWNGLENLSAIPGTVGAAPVQNIGAYGVEVCDFISNIHTYDTKENKFIDLKAGHCSFSYRNSLFKYEKGRYIITRVDFVLKRDGVVNIEYRDLKEYFGKLEIRNSKFEINSNIQIDNITPHQVREAVIAIRSAKLPDWNKWGTAGSFFKNPVVSKEKFLELKSQYPDLPSFSEIKGQSEKSDKVKIPLGWVIDNICKMKGMNKGGVGTYQKQALVIVTQPGATAKEVLDFSKELMKCVLDKTGITIEAEVEWVN